MRKIIMKTAIAAATTLMAGNALAVTWDNTSISGFLSTRYSQSDVPDFYLEHRDDNGINEDGSFYGTKLGINLSTRVNSTTSLAAQWISQSQEGGYATHLDWAFASIGLSDNTKLRAGKIKFPVGLVNEYVDVGVAYPWIQAPAVIYSELQSGPQATRESYTGASVLAETTSGDWIYTADFFAGQVDLTGMTIKGMFGLTLRANWNDAVDIQASTYTGEMKPDDPTSGMGPMMNNRAHSASLFGVKVDWNNIVAYAEAAQVEMDNVMMPGAMDSDSWYATFGYRIGQWLPHVTVQDWSQNRGYGQSVNAVGLNYSLSSKSVIKFEVSQIDSDKMTADPLLNNAIGLFHNDGADLSDDSAQVISIALDTVF